MVNHSVNIHGYEPLRPLGLRPYHCTPYPASWQLTRPRHTHSLQVYKTTSDTWFYSLLISGFSPGYWFFFPPSSFPLFHPFFFPFLPFLFFFFLFYLCPPSLSRIRAHRDRCSASAAEDNRRDRDPVQSQPPHFQVDTFSPGCLWGRYTAEWVILTTDWLWAAAIRSALDFSASCHTIFLHFFSCDALISVYSHVIGPRCQLEIGGFIQYVDTAPFSWLSYSSTGCTRTHTHTHTHTHTYTHTLIFKSTSGSVLSGKKQRAGIWALEADVRWPYSSLINEPLSHNTNFFIILEWLNSFPEGADGHDRAMGINEPDFSAAERDAEQTNIKDKADIKILFCQN